MKKDIRKSPLSEKKLIKRFNTKYKIPSSKIIGELILYKGYDRVSNIYLLMKRELGIKNIKENITARKINDMYTFDKHFRNQLKEKLEILEIFFGNKLINYLAHEADKMRKNKEEYYLDYLFTKNIFENKERAFNEFKKTYRRKNKGVKNINKAITKTDVWEYKDFFELGQLRTLYNLLKPKHKDKFIKFLNVGSINKDILSEALITFNAIRNKFYHAEQVINSEVFILPKWIENKYLTPHEKIALFLISYTSKSFSDKFLVPLLSYIGSDNIINYYNWEKVLKHKRCLIK